MLSLFYSKISIIADLLVSSEILYFTYKIRLSQEDTKSNYKLFLKKVPALKNGGILILTLVYIIVLAGLAAVFLAFGNTWFGNILDNWIPVAKLLIMSLIVCFISYLHLKKASHYRQKYKDKAYQYFFYTLMVPYLISWYALFFYPLFIKGPEMMQPVAACCIGGFLLLVMILISIQIERAGFSMVTHGMDIFTVFPEETPAVRGEIYSVVRHPLYISLVCGAVGLALIFGNNIYALSAALLNFVPGLFSGFLEDKELKERYGSAHMNYIKKSNALVPFKHPLRFWQILFSFKKFK